MATRVLLAGDETAFPAIRGIVSALHPLTRATIILEAGDPADAAWLTRDIRNHTVTVHRRGPADEGSALLRAVEAWSRAAGSGAGGLGDDFYAWLAAESRHVAQLRDLLFRTGISPERVHAQGYWNDRARDTAPVPRI